MKHTQVRIVNVSTGDSRYIPEPVTRERWFKSSGWIVQDLKVKEQEILTSTSEFLDEELSLSDSSVESEDDGFQEFTAQDEPVIKKRGRKPNSEKHGA